MREFVAVFVITLTLALVALHVGNALVRSAQSTTWHDQAVEAGYAEYYLDEDNQRQWRWLPVEEPDDE